MEGRRRTYKILRYFLDAVAEDTITQQTNEPLDVARITNKIETEAIIKAQEATMKTIDLFGTFQKLLKTQDNTIPSAILKALDNITRPAAIFDILHQSNYGQPTTVDKMKKNKEI